MAGGALGRPPFCTLSVRAGAFAEQPVLLITAPNQQLSPDSRGGAGQPPIHLLPAGLFLLPLIQRKTAGWRTTPVSLVHTYCMCLPLQDGFLNPTCSQVRWEGVRCSARQLVESSLSCHHVSQEHLCYKHYKGLFQNICPGLQLSPEGSVSSGISIQTKVRSAERDGNLSLHIYVVRCSHLPVSTVTQLCVR